MQESQIRPRNTTQGQWLLVDPEQQLLAAGEKSYTGVSLRRTIDPVARAILMPELKAAALRTTDTTVEVSHDSRLWAVRTAPVVAARSGKVTAILGMYTEVGEITPDKPVIGVWEWEISPPGPNQRMQTYWTEELFEIYGFEPVGGSPLSGSGTLPTPQWFNEVVVPEDRARMKAIIDEAIAAETSEIITVMYSVVTGHGSSKPGRRKLRLAGHAYSSETSDVVWLRGITYEIFDRIDELTPGIQSPETDDFLRAAFELATDIALAAVDTKYWHIYMTSPGWESAGLAAITNGSISSLTAKSNIDELSDFLLAAAKSPKVAANPLSIQLQTTPGVYKFFSVRASGLRSGSDENRYVMMRVSPI